MRRQLIISVMPFLGDGSTYGLRAMSYRVLRYALHRASWCKMVDAGLEWLIVRYVAESAIFLPG